VIGMVIEMAGCCDGERTQRDGFCWGIRDDCDDAWLTVIVFLCDVRGGRLGKTGGVV